MTVTIKRKTVTWTSQEFTVTVPGVPNTREYVIASIESLIDSASESIDFDTGTISDDIEIRDVFGEEL